MVNCPRTIVDRAHRVGCVSQQVQDDLLKLDAIARYLRKVVAQFNPQNHLASLKLASQAA